MKKQIEPCPYCDAPVEVKKSPGGETGFALAWHPAANNRPQFTVEGAAYCEGSGAPALPVVRRGR